MHKTFIALIAVVSAIAGTFLVVQGTQAFGFNQNMGSDRALELKANALGLTTDALKEKLETKTLSEILNDQNITSEEFRTKMKEEATQRMKDEGLSDEEIASRIQTMEERMNARQEMLASLMGIDVNTLTAKLENSSMQELLDEYEVSHVALHDAMQELREQNPGGDFGHHGARAKSQQ